MIIRVNNNKKLSILRYILVSVIFILLLSCKSLASAYFLDGPTFKTLISDKFSGNTIKYIKWSDSAPVAKDAAVLVSKPNGSDIYAWYNKSSKTMYMYTNDTDIQLDSNCKSMFNGSKFSNVRDIAFLSKVNTQEVKSMEEMFRGMKYVTSLEPLRNWDTSKVENISGMLIEVRADTLDPLANWNLANVTNSDDMLFRMTIKHLNLSSFNSDSIDFKKLFYSNGAYK